MKELANSLAIIQAKVKAPKLSIFEAVKYISYNHLTGEIIRLDRKKANGSIDKDGYLILKIKGFQFKSHRLAYVKYYNKIPNGVIDHINRNKLDNRIENLRDVSQAKNVLNKDFIPNKDTGVIGVYLDKCTKGLLKKYTSRFNGKTFRFYTIQDAINFRKSNNLNH